jgi:hypothetical protein
MIFSILAWAGGYTIDKLRDATINATIKKLNDKPLEVKLLTDVTEWLKKHGYEDTVSESLFDWYGESPSIDQPYRKIIAEEIVDKLIPSAEIWFGALKERFLEVQGMSENAADRPSLFNKPFKELESSFQELATTLVETCSREDPFFKTSVIKILNEIREQKAEKKSIQHSLTDFSDYLNDKRVLYLSFVQETQDPLIAMTKAIEEIRIKIREDIIEILPGSGDPRKWLQSMTEACHYFNNTIKELPYPVRTDTSRPLNLLNFSDQDLINKALNKFRIRFIAPTSWLLTAYEVSMPKGILKIIANPSFKHLPPKVYFDGFPLNPKAYIDFTRWEDNIEYLQYATLAEDYIINSLRMPVGTLIYFYNPIKSGRNNQLWKAVFPAGETMYFDLKGNSYSTDPVDPD